jgi:hypothetical protein
MHYAQWLLETPGVMDLIESALEERVSGVL